MSLFRGPTVRRHARLRGFTLAEVLISLAVLGILVALSMLGVQSARESARRNQCSAHLHQIGLAVAAYESTSKCFPPGLSMGASLHVALLPHLEMQSLFDELAPTLSAGNAATSLPSVAIYLCPSDGSVVYEDGAAGTNFAGNSGTWWYSHGWDGVFVYWNEYAYKDRVGPVRSADILDGLSNTHAISEILRSDQSWHRMRVRWTTPTFFSEIDALAQACRTIPPNPPQYGWQGNNWALGVPWTDGNIGATLHNHVLSPNHPSCKNAGGIAEGAYTSASNHAGGVNTLFADGHVTFNSNHVDLTVWRNAASRSGSSIH